MPRSSTRADRKPQVEIPASLTLTLPNGKLELQNVSDASNPWKVQNQAIVTLVRIAQCDNAYYAMEASKFLLEYAVCEIGRREAKKAELDARPGRIVTPAAERDAILAELKGLYAKALPATLIVEAEPAGEDKP